VFFSMGSKQSVHLQYACNNLKNDKHIFTEFDTRVLQKNVKAFQFSFRLDNFNDHFTRDHILDVILFCT
jgi:hypothetical protein